MQEQTVSRAAARRIYNTIGPSLDRAARFEARAKALGLAHLALGPGQRALQVGVGTGAEQAAIQAAVGPGGVVAGVDLSRRMLELTRGRAGGPLYEGDAARLPFAAASFDRIFSAYMLDLLPAADLPVVLAEFRRVLRPGGRMVLVSLTEGVDLPSRLFVAWWRAGFQLSPERFGGCRPLRLQPLLAAAGWAVERDVVVQRGFPSEVLAAWRGPDHNP